MRKYCLPLALLLATLGCKTMQTKPDQPQTTDQQQARLVEMQKLADVSAKVVDLARAVQDVEVQVFDSHLVAGFTLDDHKAVQRVFEQFFTETKADLEAARDASQTDATRRTAVNAIMSRARELVGKINIDSPLVKAALAAVLATVDIVNATQ